MPTKLKRCNLSLPDDLETFLEAEMKLEHETEMASHITKVLYQHKDVVERKVAFFKSRQSAGAGKTEVPASVFENIRKSAAEISTLRDSLNPGKNAP